MGKRKDDEKAILAVMVPIWKLGWLKRELEDSGFVYEVERVGNEFKVSTAQAASPVVEGVLSYRGKGKAEKRSWLGFFNVKNFPIILMSLAVFVFLAFGFFYFGFSMDMVAVALSTIGILITWGFISRPSGPNPENPKQALRALIEGVLGLAFVLIFVVGLFIYLFVF